MSERGLSQRFHRQEEAAARCAELGKHVSPFTLQTMRHRGGGPKFRKDIVSGAVIYADEDIVAWVSARLTRPISSTKEVCPK
jgi:hypothetical protein